MSKVRVDLNPRCVAGYPIGKTKKIDVHPGPCEVCGAGPLHGVWLANINATNCRGRCSFVRCGMRVCRQCAIGFDLLANGRTSIHTQPEDGWVPDPDTYRQVIHWMRRGHAVMKVAFGD